MLMSTGAAPQAGAVRRSASRGAIALALAASLAPWAAQAADPDNGTLTTASEKVEYDSGPFAVSNPSGAATDEPVCASPIAECDEFTLTVELPADYATTNPNDQIRITTSWTMAVADSPEDIDIYLLDETGSAIANSASASNPEIMTVPAGGGTHTYTVRVVPFTVAGATPHTTIELVRKGAIAMPESLTPSVAPRFRVYEPTSGRAGSAGEPSIGYSVGSKRAFFQASFETDRVTFPEDLPQPLPEAADALWENKSYPYNTVSLDPIGFTDRELGRVFASQLTGANSIFGFSDDDGETWTPGQFGPPNGGADHQTTGSGPYPAGAPFDQLRSLSVAAGFGNAVYYCSQSSAASFCARSDDGGLTFGPGIPTWTALECGGLHGHVRVAYDGTVAVPNKGCGNGQGVALSFDAGNTWSVSVVPGTSRGVTDPQLSWSESEDPQTHQPVGYLCFVDGNGHPKAAVTRDRGESWSDPVDIGNSEGIKNAVFAQGIAGDHDRAACAFIGTQTSGNHGSLSFDGIWYPYIAMTYDGGATWQTVNASPTDPVQGAGGICTDGTTCGSNRNLLDFNEMALDEEGRPLLGYADGCIGACVQTPANNSFSNRGAIIRQSGGLTLLSAFDNTKQFYATAVVPGQPYLEVSGADANVLNWKAPDDGGSPITGYKIYKDGALLATLSQPKLTYTDSTAGTGSAYAVSAFNDIGEGVNSGAAVQGTGGGSSTVGEQCQTPGVLVSEDNTGDQTTHAPGQDVLAVYIAEPGAGENLILSLQVDDLSLQPLPAETSYELHFTVPGDVKTIGANALVDRTLTFDSTTQAFEIGHTETDATTGTNSSANDGPVDGQLDVSNNRIVWTLPKTNNVITALASAPSIEGVSGQVWQRGGVIILRVDESAGGSYTISASGACEANTAPVAELLAVPQTGTAPLTVQFTASGTDQDGDAIVEYTLDYGDGGSDAQANGSFTHTYSTSGNYPARLTVKDARGALSSNTAEKVIQVAGAGSMSVTLDAEYSKSANADGTYTVSQTDPLEVTFTATTQSTDGSPYWYTFNFGDGNSVGPQRDNTAMHAYADANQDGYHVTVTMTDDGDTQYAESNEVLIRTTTSVVINGGTVIDLVVAQDGDTAPVQVTADANGPNVMHDASTASTEYTFDFGDNSATVTNTTGSASHVYTKPVAAIYTINVTMTDKDAGGNVLGTSSGSVDVAVNSGNRLTALLSINPTTAAIGDTITFDGCRSFTADGETITRFVLDPDGDGSLPAIDGGTNCSFTYQYASAGTYTPTLTVTDSTSATAKASASTVRVVTSGASGNSTANGTGGGALRHSGGGSFGWLSLAPLMLALARRRRATLH